LKQRFFTIIFFYGTTVRKSILNTTNAEQTGFIVAIPSTNGTVEVGELTIRPFKIILRSAPPVATIFDESYSSKSVICCGVYAAHIAVQFVPFHIVWDMPVTWTYASSLFRNRRRTNTTIATGRQFHCRCPVIKSLKTPKAMFYDFSC